MVLNSNKQRKIGKAMRPAVLHNRISDKITLELKGGRELSCTGVWRKSIKGRRNNESIAPGRKSASGLEELP